jgi:hypothetical protein
MALDALWFLRAHHINNVTINFHDGESFRCHINFIIGPRWGGPEDVVQISIKGMVAPYESDVEKNVMKACLEELAANGYYILDFIHLATSFT